MICGGDVSSSMGTIASSLSWLEEKDRSPKKSKYNAVSMVHNLEIKTLASRVIPIKPCLSLSDSK